MKKTIDVTMPDGTIKEFPYVPITCKIGDTIWFKDDRQILEGEVIDIDNDYWWIYSGDKRSYGRVIVKFTTEDHIEQCYPVDACDILYREPIGENKPVKITRQHIYKFFKDKRYLASVDEPNILREFVRMDEVIDLVKNLGLNIE